MHGTSAAKGAGNSIAKSILLATLVAGSLDILYAVIIALNSGGSGASMLRFVASGPLPSARSWSVAGPIAGLLVHFFLMAAMAGAFMLAASRSEQLTRKPIRWGILYGIATYVVMNFVVLPARFGSPIPPSANTILTYLFPHIVLVGIPIALIAARSGNCAAASES